MIKITLNNTNNNEPLGKFQIELKFQEWSTNDEQHILICISDFDELCFDKDDCLETLKTGSEHLKRFIEKYFQKLTKNNNKK